MPTDRTPFDPKTLKALAGLQFKARYVVEGYLSGMHESPFSGYSVEFSEYRSYQPGDDLRHLDWRYYARADKLYVKIFEQETNLQFHLVVDSSKSMLYRGKRAWATKFDYAKILAGAMAWLLLKQQDATALLTLTMNGPEKKTGERSRGVVTSDLNYIKPSQKPSQFGRILGALDSMMPASGPCLGLLLENLSRLIRRRCVILLVTDLLDPVETVQEQIKQLHFRGHEVIVFHVLDPDELDFPFDKSGIFEDLESGVRRRVNPSQAKAQYLTRFNAFLEDHRQLFASLEIPYLLLPSDSDPGRALAFFLSQRKVFV